MRQLLQRFQFTLCGIYLFIINLEAQCPAGGPGCEFPAVDPALACILSSPSVLNCYQGMTTSAPPIVIPPWCGAIHNNHFFAFIADAPQVSFTITCGSCSNGTGIQAGLFEAIDCVNFPPELDCLGDIPPGTTGTLTASVTPGEVYFLCIDGSAGDLCSYSINTQNPVLEGPDQICLPGTTSSTLTLPLPANWTISPPGIGTISGFIHSTTLNINWQNTGTVQICANTGCPLSQPTCHTINVGADVSTTENHAICLGEVATCGGEEFTSAGTYTVTLPTSNGCDSTIKCMIKIHPVIPPTNLVVNVCGATDYQICDNSYGVSGIYSYTCQSIFGCDSVVNLNLTILDPIAKITPPPVLGCEPGASLILSGSGSSVNTAPGGVTLYHWSGPGIVGSAVTPNITVNQPGEYCLVVVHRKGSFTCSDTACVTVTMQSDLPSPPVITGQAFPCPNTQQIYTASTPGNIPASSYLWQLPGSIAYTAVAEDTILVNWSNTGISSTICVTAENLCGSSSPTCIPIAIATQLDTPYINGLSAFCGPTTSLFTLENEQSSAQYNWYTEMPAMLSGTRDSVYVNFPEAGLYKVCVAASNACTEIMPVCKQVQINTTPVASLSAPANICAGTPIALQFNMSGTGPFEVIWDNGNTTDTLSGIDTGYSMTLFPETDETYRLLSVSDYHSPACTSLLTDSVHVTVHPILQLSQALFTCRGTPVYAGGALQYLTGEYIDTLTGVYGCDSIVTTYLQVIPADTVLLKSKTCDPNLAGVFTQHLQQVNGCDSIITRVVTYAISDTTFSTSSTCDPAAAGIFSALFSTAEGCDSIVFTTVQLLPKDTTIFNSISCNSLNAGIFPLILTNAAGCDSVVIHHIAFSPLDTLHFTSYTCDPAQTGIFSQQYITAAGCDSIVFTTVELLHSDTTIYTSSTCNSQQVGEFAQILTNIAGCDSTVIHHIAFSPLDTFHIISYTCDPAQTGVFTQKYSSAAGCDSVVTTSVIGLSTSAQFIYYTTCDPSGLDTMVQTLVNQFGCDSIITHIPVFKSADTTLMLSSVCDITQTGTFIHHYIGHSGCDSVVIAKISLIPSSASLLTYYTCIPTDTGTFTYIFSNFLGCDSVVTEHRLLMPRDTVWQTFTTCDSTQAGLSIVQLTNHWGCDSIIIKNTLMSPINECNIDFTLNTIINPCSDQGGAISIVPITGLSPFAYQLFKDGLLIQSGTIPDAGNTENIFNLSSGTYVSVLTSANGLISSRQVTITLPPLPSVSLSILSDNNGYAVSCYGGHDGKAEVTVTGGSPPFQIAWSNGTHLPMAVNLEAGTYLVTVTDQNGCSTTSQTILGAPPLLQLSLETTDLPCINPKAAYIIANVDGGVSPYEFRLDSGVLQFNNQFKVWETGMHIITVADANQCKAVSSAIIKESPLPWVDLGDDQTIALGESAHIIANTNIAADSIRSIHWESSSAIPLCTDCLEQTVIPLASSIYAIKIVSMAGCEAEDRMLIFVDRRKQIYAPNVFTPGGTDNTYFSLFSKPGIVVRFNNFNIYDRWGGLVFHMDELPVNAPDTGWDGKVDGQLATPGVYVWFVEAIYLDGESVVLKGDITLTP